jgi:hypothetical protein
MRAKIRVYIVRACRGCPERVVKTTEKAGITSVVYRCAQSGKIIPNPRVIPDWCSLMAFSDIKNRKVKRGIDAQD